MVEPVYLLTISFFSFFFSLFYLFKKQTNSPQVLQRVLIGVSFIFNPNCQIPLKTNAFFLFLGKKEKKKRCGFIQAFIHALIKATNQSEETKFPSNKGDPMTLLVLTHPYKQLSHNCRRKRKQFLRQVLPHLQAFRGCDRCAATLRWAFQRFWSDLPPGHFFPPFQCLQTRPKNRVHADKLKRAKD